MQDGPNLGCSVREARFFVSLLWLWMLLVCAFFVVIDLGLLQPDSPSSEEQTLLFSQATCGSWLFITALLAIGIGFYGCLQLALIRVHANQDTANSRCFKCGYALTGLDSTRCPECFLDQPSNQTRMEAVELTAMKREMLLFLTAAVAWVGTILLVDAFLEFQLASLPIVAAFLMSLCVHKFLGAWLMSKITA